MQPLRFGDNFELDPGAYQLRRSGQALRLERIPMEILLLLTEHRGQLVTREQIVERVWGKDAALDVDNSINGAIRKIRQVLKDDPEQPRFIETIASPRRCEVPSPPRSPPPSRHPRPHGGGRGSYRPPRCCCSAELPPGRSW